jgi:hypothetical protein
VPNRGLEEGQTPARTAAIACRPRSRLPRQPGGFEGSRPDGSVSLDWPIARATYSQTFSRASAFGLLLDVFLRDRGQQCREYAEPGEDVDDREDLRPRARRVEVSVANGRQRHDRELEGLDHCPVLGSPVEDRPREHQRPRDKGQRPGLGVTHDGGDGPSQ